MLLVVDLNDQPASAAPEHLLDAYNSAESTLVALHWPGWRTVCSGVWSMAAASSVVRLAPGNERLYDKGADSLASTNTKPYRPGVTGAHSVLFSALSVELPGSVPFVELSWSVAFGVLEAEDTENSARPEDTRAQLSYSVSQSPRGPRTMIHTRSCWHLPCRGRRRACKRKA